MTFDLTPEQDKSIDKCPRCGNNIYAHNDYHRHDRGVCDLEPHHARRLAVAAIVAEAVAVERKRVEDQFNCSATVSWGRCGFSEWCER